MMTLKMWRRWFRSLPWAMRWFVILILIRPVVDMFHFLKEISPLISPLYIVGVATPLLIIFSFNSKELSKTRFTRPDLVFMMWGVIVAINLVNLLGFSMTIDMVGDLLKYALPFFLFFYLRRIIRTEKDLNGILQSFLYSSLIPAGLILYEYIFGPVRASELSLARGGGDRFSGAYADVMNYAIYIIGSFLILGYFYLKKQSNRRLHKTQNRWFLVGLPVMILGLFAIKHVSSWAVFAGLFGLLLLFSFLRFRISGPMLIVFILPGIFFQDIVERQLQPLVEKEIRVIEGEAKIERSFNGRMSRWKRYFDIWQDMPLYTQMLGTPLYSSSSDPRRVKFEIDSGLREKIPVMVGGGMHSDYVRLVFLTGVLGFSLYLIFLFTLFQRRSVLDEPGRFLLLGTLVVILFYSISTNPLLYQPLLYFTYPVFAYAILIRNRKDESPAKTKDSNLKP